MILDRNDEYPFVDITNIAENIRKAKSKRFPISEQAKDILNQGAIYNQYQKLTREDLIEYIIYQTIGFLSIKYADNNSHVSVFLPGNLIALGCKRFYITGNIIIPLLRFIEATDIIILPTWGDVPKLDITFISTKTNTIVYSTVDNVTKWVGNSFSRIKHIFDKAALEEIPHIVVI